MIPGPLTKNGAPLFQDEKAARRFFKPSGCEAIDYQSSLRKGEAGNPSML